MPGLTLALGLLVILAAVAAILRKADVRLALLLAAFALAVLAALFGEDGGAVAAVAQKFFATLVDDKFVVPICSAMGFAYVLRHTQCDQHLIRLLVEPLRRVRPLLVPGAVLVGCLVNVPVISQTSTAVAVGTVLVPLLQGAGVSPVTTGAALLLGASIGGELLNLGAPELRTVTNELRALPPETRQEGGDAHVVAWIARLLPLHLAVAVTVFWWRQRRDVPPAEEVAPLPPGEFRINPIKALVPLLPLVLLFLTVRTGVEPLVEVPRAWLTSPRDVDTFDSRLIGAAMLIGVVAAALTSPRSAGGVAGAFFEGAGFAYAHIISLIVTASCFGEGVKRIHLADAIGAGIAGHPALLLVSATVLPLAFAALSGSGMAATQSLYRLFVPPALALGVDPTLVGALVALGAAAGRTMSPVAAVTLMAASLTKTDPFVLARKVAIPLLVGLAAVVAMAVGWT